ncbi:hypothetical protein DT076_06020 [Desertihabitans brevis]|uniref:Uncharacterized protein n=1 Tax=Desertihabitans brevis TaxID=2268447 RepID=A0A367YWW2_9ACTN|nr:hypothetical protein [Desertihabitans brevis]RCK70227.1 hypothetical protein DT076_06020 [Desertihabitans brevis]
MRGTVDAVGSIPDDFRRTRARADLVRLREGFVYPHLVHLDGWDAEAEAVHASRCQERLSPPSG